MDFTLYSLPGAIKKIVAKTGPLPAGDSVRQRFKAFLGSLDSTEPPKLIELGEFKPSDVPVAPMRKPSMRACFTKASDCRATQAVSGWSVAGDKTTRRVLTFRKADTKTSRSPFTVKTF